MQDQEKAWQEFLCKHKNKLSDTKQLHLLQAAVKYRSKDFSVIAVKKNKCPVMSWKEDQQKVPDDERLIAGFLTSTAEAIAIVCGGVSTNLEVIDVDTKNDIQGNLPVRLKRAIEKNIPGLFERLYVVITP